MFCNKKFKTFTLSKKKKEKKARTFQFNLLRKIQNLGFR